MRKEYPLNPLVGVSALIKYVNDILIVRRAYDPAKNLWSLPGGMVELGESLKESIVREIKEELGIKIIPLCLFDVAEYIENDISGKVKYHFIILVYYAEIDKPDSITLSDEITDARWISPEDALKLKLTKSTREIIKKFISKKLSCIDS